MYNDRRGEDWKRKTWRIYIPGIDRREAAQGKGGGKTTGAGREAEEMWFRGAKAEGGFKEAAVNNVRYCRKLKWIEPVLLSQELLPSNRLWEEFPPFEGPGLQPLHEGRSSSTEKEVKLKTTESTQVRNAKGRMKNMSRSREINRMHGNTL